MSELLPLRMYEVPLPLFRSIYLLAWLQVTGYVPVRRNATSRLPFSTSSAQVSSYP